MKGSEKVIATLNDLLSDELTAVNQYMVHAGMDQNWGYEKLHEAVEKRAITEMSMLKSSSTVCFSWTASPLSVT